MANEAGRPDHITDALNSHGNDTGGTPFGYENKEQVYANLVMYGGLAKPSKSSLEAELAVLQADWDKENAPYRLARAKAYPPKEEQLDMIYHNIDAWRTLIKAIKDANPKP